MKPEAEYQRSETPRTHSGIFKDHRPLLFSIAYEMLGSVMDAEDVVQDAFLRWQEVDLDRIRSAKGYLATIATRLSLDRLRDARREREVYPGPWVPEPLRTEAPVDPVVEERAITTAFLRILEALTPMQRAAFLLREVFGSDYGEVARALDTTEAACRQHVSRARKRLRKGDTRYDADPEQARAVAEKFVACLRGGEAHDLMALLAPDVVSWSDGGGRFPGAARRPVLGPDNVAGLLLGAARRVPDTEEEITRMNGYPAVVLRREGRAVGAVSLRIREGRIREIFIVVNPVKLEHLHRSVDGGEPCRSSS